MTLPPVEYVDQRLQATLKLCSQIPETFLFKKVGPCAFTSFTRNANQSSPA